MRPSQLDSAFLATKRRGEKKTQNTQTRFSPEAKQTEDYVLPSGSLLLIFMENFHPSSLPSSMLGRRCDWKTPEKVEWETNVMKIMSKMLRLMKAISQVAFNRREIRYATWRLFVVVKPRSELKRVGEGAKEPNTEDGNVCRLLVGARCSTISMEHFLDDFGTLIDGLGLLLLISDSSKLPQLTQSNYKLSTIPFILNLIVSFYMFEDSELILSTEFTHRIKS